MKDEIVIYQPNETFQLEVHVQDDSVWLNRQQMALLFDRDVKTIGKHIKNALQEELKPVVANFATTQSHDENPVVSIFATTAADGKTYTLDAKKYYTNLEVYLNSIVEEITKAQNKNATSAVDEYYPTFVDPTGISTLAADDYALVLSTRYVTLSGMEINNPDGFEGVLIRINTLSNGKQVATKILNR